MGKPPFIGGIENVIDTLLNSNISLQYEFSLFDTYRKPDPKRNLLQKVSFAMCLPFLCASHVIKTRPQIAHIHFCSKIDFWKHGICLIVCKLMCVKTVFHLHGGTFDTFYNHLSKPKQRLARFLLRQPDILVALSIYWYYFLSQFTEPQKIRTIPNPINCKKLSTYSQTGPDFSQAHSVVLLGSIGKRKGHFDVLKAIPKVLSKFPDTQFYFGGLDEDPGATAKLKEIAAETDIASNTHFLGAVAGVDKLKLLGESGVLILPSYGENMPISVLEGMAASKPVIATKVGAVPEVITDQENGILITPGDWQNLAEQLNFLFSFPQKATKIGEEAGKHVRENWDVDKIITKHDKLYVELLAQ